MTATATQVQTVKVDQHAGTGLLVFGYVCALLGGFFSIIIGISLRKRVNVEGTKQYLYDEPSRRHGLIMLILGVVFLVFFTILGNM